MKKLMIFDDIAYEVEHPLFLARIQMVPTERFAKVMINEFERKSVPIYAVQVVYVPKFDRVGIDGGPFAGMESAYRVLFKCAITVGESHLKPVLMELTHMAQHLAEGNPDPAEWSDQKGGCPQ